MVKRENLDELSLGTSGRLSNLEGTNLSIDANGNLNAAGGDGGGGEGYIMEDFAAGNLAAYSGDTGVYSVVAGDISGGNMLRFDDNSGAVQMIYRTDIATQRGMSYAAYVRSTGSTSPTFVVNGQHDGAGTLTAGYGVLISPPRDEVHLVHDPANALGTPLDTVAVAINANTLYRLELDLGFDTIQARVIDDTETTVATLSSTDAQYDTGVLGWRDASGTTATSDFDFATRLPRRL